MIEPDLGLECPERGGDTMIPWQTEHVGTALKDFLEICRGDGKVFCGISLAYPGRKVKFLMRREGRVQQWTVTKFSLSFQKVLSTEQLLSFCCSAAVCRPAAVAAVVAHAVFLVAQFRELT